MTLQGDLETLDLGDVLQSLAARRASGTFHVEELDGRATQVSLVEGCVSLLARPGRPSLPEVLVLAGELTREELEQVKRKRRRTRRSLGEVAVSLGYLDEAELVAFARARLVAETCEVLTIEHGRFRFEAGRVPRGVFDPEERRLRLSVPVGPLLLESARRSDHWREIRHVLPHDGAYLRRLSGVRPDDSELAAKLMQRIDGRATVADLVAGFPHLRFEAYQTLSEWVRAGRAARLDADALVTLAKEEVDPERAQECVERGLREYPNHLELLALRVALAEELGELDDAVEALKLRVHAQLGSGNEAEARVDLARARQLAPNDAALVERSFELCRSAGDVPGALEAGRRWVELLRAPGLHGRAAEVLERLRALAPEDEAICIDLARARADQGRVADARALLDGAYRTRLDAADDRGAKVLVDALLDLDPANEAARLASDELASGAYRARRESQRRWTRLVLGALLAGGVATFALFEWSARTEFRETARSISESGWIETGRYREAADSYRAVRVSYPWTITGLLDVPEAVRELERKARSAR